MKYYVDELPRSCFYCDCCHTKEYDPRHKTDGEKFCGIENTELPLSYCDFEYNNLRRPDWCPLREIPSEKEYYIGINEYNEGYVDGWNYLVNELLEG